MKLREIKISEVFTPEFNDNKKLPATEQMKIKFKRIPGTAERMKYIKLEFRDGGTSLIYNDIAMSVDFIDSIENFEVGSKKVKTGEDLATLNHPEITSLFPEIRNHLFPENEEITEGESEA